MSYVPFDSEWFYSLILDAQDGHPVARDTVVMCSMPIVWKLTPDQDEQQELVCHLLGYSLPKWTGGQPWAVHLTVTLMSKLLTLRRTEYRYRSRFINDQERFS